MNQLEGSSNPQSFNINKKSAGKKAVFVIFLILLLGIFIYAIVPVASNGKWGIKSITSFFNQQKNKVNQFVDTKIQSDVVKNNLELVENKRTTVAMPKMVKGIYVSASTVSSNKRFSELINLVDTTELNTMVIDIKIDNGQLAFAPKNPELKPFAATKSILGDLNELTSLLHQKNIYLIARVFVFQDPFFASIRKGSAIKNTSGGIWTDAKGITWTDPASKEVWIHNVAVAREVYDAGFDEIQFDYIRFPTDGKISTMVYPVYNKTILKQDVMAEFFVYLNSELRVKNQIPISADLFGLTMTAKTSDLNIGQKLITALPNFTAISPMVYPSHYPPGYLGYKNPALYPYEVIAENMTKGNAIIAEEQASFSAKNSNIKPNFATIRPWIQDFDLGAVYTSAMIRKEMQAVYDGGGSGWLLWNARNVYNLDALNKE